MQIKALLFDLDGVILDSEKVYFSFWKKASEQLGYNIPPEVFLMLRSCDSSIANSIIKSYTNNDDNAYPQIRELRKAFMKEWSKKNSFEIKPGVKDFLMSCKKHSLKKVIVTSSITDEKINILRDNGLENFFDQIVSVKNVERNKPYPDIYIHACKILELSPHDCLALEDSPNGIESAYNAGVNVIMIPDLTPPNQDIANKCIVVNNIADVLLLLKD